MAIFCLLFFFVLVCLHARVVLSYGCSSVCAKVRVSLHVKCCYASHDTSTWAGPMSCCARATHSLSIHLSIHPPIHSSFQSASVCIRMLTHPFCIFMWVDLLFRRVWSTSFLVSSLSFIYVAWWECPAWCLKCVFFDRGADIFTSLPSYSRLKCQL